MDKIRFSKVAIIAGDVNLAEEVCKYFRKDRIYLTLFEAPIKRLEEYGVFTNECIHLCNAVRFLKPRCVLLLGCDDDVINTINKYLSSKVIFSLKFFDRELLSKLPGYSNAPHIVELHPVTQCNPRGNIIAVEDHNEDNSRLSQVIAKNLAAFIGGEVVIIPSATRKECDEIQEYLRIWASANDMLERTNARDFILYRIKLRLATLTSSSPESISFFTLGIPYGIYSFDCPTTHYFIFPVLGLNIVKGMIKTTSSSFKCKTACLFDPGELEDSEFDNLADGFLSKGYLLRKSFGKSATVREANYITQYFPLDAIFYSTHCGEVDGRTIKEQFTTSDGENHIIVYDLAASFAPKPGTDQVEVLELMRWISLDGVEWTDDAGKDRIGAGEILTEYIELRRTGNHEERIIRVIETSDSYSIKHSDSLKMYDFNYMPMPTELGAQRYPIVFNNACSSWRELGLRFVIAGASIYIGTSMDIANSIAIDVATNFTKQMLNGRSIGYSLFRAQKKFIADLNYTPYLMHGYLHTKCLSSGSAKRNALHLYRELKVEINKWKQKSVQSQISEVKSNSKEIATFLEEELKRFTHIN